jgi:hypothetical protein
VGYFLRNQIADLLSSYMQYLIFISALLFFSTQSFSQQIFQSYIKQNDSIRVGPGKEDVMHLNEKGYSLVLPDSKENLKGMIIALDEGKFDPKDSTLLTFYQFANSKGFALLHISSGIPFDLYFKEKSLTEANEVIKTVVNKYQIPNKNIFLLGVSLAGIRALKYVVYCKTHKSGFHPDIKGVVLCDSAIDWVRQYMEEEKALKDKFSESSVNEAKWVTWLFNKNLNGTLKSNREAYLSYSPYSRFDESNRYIKYYTDISLRAYSEPATMYWMEKKGKGVYETNFPDMVGIINEVKTSRQ